MLIFGLSLLSSFLAVIPWPLTSLQATFGLLFIILQSALLGQKFFSDKSPWFRWLLGLLVLTTAVIISGSIFFYLYNLSTLSLDIITFLPSFLLLWPQKIQENKNREDHGAFHPTPLTLRLLLPLFYLGYLLVFTVLLTILSGHKTTIAIQSPWLVLPPSAFVLYFTASLLVIAINRLSRSYRAILNSLHFFLSLGLVLFIYPLGFGFDPFIHQATEQIIQTTGTLNPKPFYYVGHYSLVIWLNALTSFPLKALDSWLLPLAASLWLPPAIFYSFRESFQHKTGAIQLLPLVFLTLPYSGLIQSTPQAMSFLFSLLIIFLSLFYINRKGISLTFIALLALATALFHPLTGIPVIFFTVLLGLYHRFWHRQGLSKYMRVIGYWSLSLVAAIALPLVFIFNSYLSRGSSSNINLTENPLSAPNIFSWYYHRFDRLEDLLYLWGNNIKLVIIALSLIGLGFMLRKRRAHYFLHYCITFLVLLSNFFLLRSFVSFSFLIPYERLVFPERILQLSLYFLLPFAFISLYLLFRKLLATPAAIQVICWLFLASGLTISWYLSYPRFDFYEQNKGFNTTATDFEAVSWINQQKSENYVVLANQSVSAAAVEKYGFAKYYNSTFYYPIPTGDPLYQLYLDLANNRREVDQVLLDVQKLTGVSTIYFVLNNYWSGYEDLIVKHTKTASSVQSLAEGSTYIFTYHLSQ